MYQALWGYKSEYDMAPLQVKKHTNQTEIGQWEPVSQVCVKE